MITQNKGKNNLNFMIIENLQIKKITTNGFGIGHNDGKTIFVLGAIKDDIVSVKTYHKKKDIFLAQIVSFVQKSKLRTENHDCKNHKICGGCIWLDIKYENQLKLKQDCLKEFFAKYNLEEITASKNFLHYRNKCFLPISLDGTIGIYEKNSHNVLNVSNCILQPKIFNELISETQKYIFKAKVKIYNEKTHNGTLRFLGLRINEKNEILLILVSRSKKLPFIKSYLNNMLKKFPQIKGIVLNLNKEKSNKILGEENITLYGEDFLFHKIKDKIFKVSSNSFYQINSSQIENLYDFVKENIAKNSQVIDAYSGVGTIGIYLANSQKKIFCIEENPFSVQNMKENIKLNSIDNVEIFQAKVEDFLDNISDIEKFDCLILDPPRKGIEKSIIKKCENISKIIYISCNPATLLRDIHLFEEIGFAVKKIKTFDMFPFTHHIESITILEKK